MCLQLAGPSNSTATTWDPMSFTILSFGLANQPNWILKEFLKPVVFLIVGPSSLALMVLFWPISQCWAISHRYWLQWKIMVRTGKDRDKSGEQFGFVVASEYITLHICRPSTEAKWYTRLLKRSLSRILLRQLRKLWSLFSIDTMQDLPAVWSLGITPLLMQSDGLTVSVHNCCFTMKLQYYRHLQLRNTTTTQTRTESI